MKIKNLVCLLTAASLTIASVGNAVACTSLIMMDVNGNAYHARTMEFSSRVPTELTYYPAGTKITSATPAGAQGLTFNTKFAILGMAGVKAMNPNAKQATFAEGANDQGLSFSMNWLNGTTSPAVGTDNSKILAVSDLGAWVLGNFKTAADVKTAMTNGSTEFWVPVLKSLDPTNPLPQHYSVHDKKGGSIVIEFTNGKVNVYDNPVGVMTNGPEFPWHLQNLNNYTFTNVDKNTGQLGKMKLATQDAGIALTALPSAQTSQGRFVKGAFYVNYVRKAKNPDDAIITLGHVINNFDRPHDLSVDGSGGTGDGVRSQSTSSEVTEWTVMADLSRNLYYVRSINALNWSVIDINKLKDVKQIKSVSSYEVNKAGADAFNLFYK
jgi:choloylglycine hydrolase